LSAILLQADAMGELPMASGRVHSVVTSPPYWGHRDYAAGSNVIPFTQFRPMPELGEEARQDLEEWRGDYGQEPTAMAYVGHTVRWMRHVRRVLRPDGVVWIVVGDTLSGNNSLAPGSRMAIPHRVLLALEADGWTVRMDAVWHKPGPMPEPNAGHRWEQHRIKVKKAVEDWRKIARTREGVVDGAVAHVAGGNYGFRHKAEWKDCPGCPKCDPHGGYVLRLGSWRHTAAHETILMCTLGMGYWSDSSAAAEPAGDWKPAYSRRTASRKRGEFSGKTNALPGEEAFRAVRTTRNPRSVLTVATSTYPGKHFATYPPELVRRLAVATCPARACAICGAGYAPVVERSKHPTRDVEAERADDADRTGRQDGHVSGPSGQTDETKVIGHWPTCDCGTEEWKPGLLLDPFCGSGTTGEVARELGLNFVGTDLSFAYLRDQARIRVLRAGGRSDDLPLFGGAT
jgi:hypothetical protein